MSNCNLSRNKAQHQYILDLGDCAGTISLLYDINPENATSTVPCKVTILYKDEIYTTNFIGDALFNDELLSKGLPVVSSSVSSGVLSFIKDNYAPETARLIIDTPLNNSSVNINLDCPICDVGSDSGTDTNLTTLCVQCRDTSECDIEAGTDFLRTPGFKEGEPSTLINLDFGNGITPVSFGGIPIDSTNLGESDTIVKRILSVKAPVQATLIAPDVSTTPDDTTTSIQIMDLSLKSLEPINTPDGPMDIYVGIDRAIPFQQNPNGAYEAGSGGSMSIAYDNTFTGGIWSSNFNVNVVFVAVPAGSQAAREPQLDEVSPGEFVFIGGEANLVRNLISENCPCIQNLIDNPPNTPIDPSGHPCAGVDPGCVPYFKEEFKAENETWKKNPEETESISTAHYIVNVDNPKVTEYGTNDCNFFIDAQAVHDAGEGVTHGVDGARNTTTILSGGSGGALSAFRYEFDPINKKWVKIFNK